MMLSIQWAVAVALVVAITSQDVKAANMRGSQKPKGNRNKHEYRKDSAKGDKADFMRKMGLKKFSTQTMVDETLDVGEVISFADAHLKPIDGKSTSGVFLVQESGRESNDGFVRVVKHDGVVRRVTKQTSKGHTIMAILVKPFDKGEYAVFSAKDMDEEELLEEELLEEKNDELSVPDDDDRRLVGELNLPRKLGACSERKVVRIHVEDNDNNGFRWAAQEDIRDMIDQSKFYLENTLGLCVTIQLVGDPSGTCYGPKDDFVDILSSASSFCSNEKTSVIHKYSQYKYPTGNHYGTYPTGNIDMNLLIFGDGSHFTDTGVRGCAFPAVICTQLAVGVVNAGHWSNPLRQYRTVSHEIGHLLGAHHDERNMDHIMGECRSLAECNMSSAYEYYAKYDSADTFSADSVARINSNIASKSVTSTKCMADA